jgi:quercetin dioxygenase-like cupin family protein
MTVSDGQFPRIRAGEGATYSLIGELITFKITSAQTGDTFSMTELISQPQGGPPLHTHPAAEAFVIVEGEFEFSGLNEGLPYAIRATPGDIVYIPGGAPHTYKTVSPTPGRALGVLVPGGEMERFFAEVGTSVADPAALAAPSGPPSEAELARHMEIAQRHGIVFLFPKDTAHSPVDAARSWDAADRVTGK